MADYDDAGELVGLTPSNFVFGRAKVDGRAVIVEVWPFVKPTGTYDRWDGEGRKLAPGKRSEAKGTKNRSRDYWKGLNNLGCLVRDGLVEQKQQIPKE